MERSHLIYRKNTERGYLHRRYAKPDDLKDVLIYIAIILLGTRIGAIWKRPTIEGTLSLLENTAFHYPVDPKDPM